MTFEFHLELPYAVTVIETLTIYDNTSQQFRYKYISIYDSNKAWFYQLEYSENISHWERILLTNNTLSFRNDFSVRLFDTRTKQEINLIEFEEGYESIYFEYNEFYIAGPWYVYCIGEIGNIKWISSQIAIDGIVINSFTDDKLQVSAQYDPPDGWQEYTINRLTGEIIEPTSPSP